MPSDAVNHNQPRASAPSLAARPADASLDTVFGTVVRRSPVPPRPDGAAVDPAELDPHRWIEQHGTALYRYARARLDTDEAAEDAVQECLLAAIEKTGSFTGQSSVRTWLIGILKHKVYDAIRARYRDAERRDRLLRDLHGGPPTPATHEPAPSPAPTQTGLETDELRDTIARGIRALPPVMRDAIRLKDIDGLSTETVCEMLGVTATNLWTILHRAKQRLREELKRSDSRSREGRP